MTEYGLTHGFVAAGKRSISRWRGPLWAIAFAIVLVVGFQERAHAETTTYSNSSQITMPSYGAATPYPAQFRVCCGFEGTVTDVNLKLWGYSHQYPQSVDVVLEGPTGATATVMSDVGSDFYGANDLNLFLDDEAESALGYRLTSGTFRPRNNEGRDSFPDPSPIADGGSALSQFDGTNPNGYWRLYVHGDDPSNNGVGKFSGGWSLTISYDHIDTAIDSGPSDVSDTKSASFTFSSSQPSSGFQCSLDGSPFTGCTSPQGYEGLAVGQHKFEVKAVDAYGYADSTPAVRSWTVDDTPPDTTISSGPNGMTNDTTPTFSFSGSDDLVSADQLLYSYRFDAGSWSTFTSDTSATPGNEQELVDGSHTFQVRAKDKTGNTDQTPAEQTFAVDTIAPSATVSSGPSGTVNNTSPAFAFSSSEEGSTFECRLDDETTFNDCASPKKYVDLADGNHTFSVRTTDAAGNAGPIANREWKVDTTAPAITGLRPLPNTTVADRTPSVGATIRDAGTNLVKGNVTLRVDGRGVTAFKYDPAKGRLSYTPTKNLSYGRHTVEILARDGVGLSKRVVWSLKVIR